MAVNPVHFTGIWTLKLRLNFQCVSDYAHPPERLIV